MFGSQRAAISNCKQSMRMNPQTVIGNWSASSRNLDFEFFFCTRLFFQFVTSSNFRPRIFFFHRKSNYRKVELEFFWSGSIKYNFRIIFCKSRLIFCFWNNISLSGYFDRNGTPYLCSALKILAQDQSSWHGSNYHRDYVIYKADISSVSPLLEVIRSYVMSW